MADSDNDERIYSVAAGKNKSTPWDRIWAGILSHQYLVLPLAAVSAIGIVQIIVPWWIVWPIIIAAGAMYWKNREVKVKKQVENYEKSQQELERELLHDEIQTDKQKAEEKERRLQKEREIAARIEAELLAMESPAASRNANASNKGGKGKQGKGGNAAQAKKGNVPAAVSSSAEVDEDDDDTFFMAQMVKGSKKGLGSLDMKDVIAASSSTEVPPSRKGVSEEAEEAAPAPASSSGGRRRQNRAKSDGSWQQS